VLDQGPARHRARLGVEQVCDLAQHGQQTAGPVEVLHQVAAGRLEVDQQRHRRPDAVEVLERQLDPQPPGQGE
jgi:hypothetical protein